MPYEDHIQELFNLFLQYKLARSPAEQSRLDSAIMQLFDTLGASLSPAILKVRGDFERLRKAPAVDDSPAKELRKASHSFARKRIAAANKATGGAVELSWGARELLRVPLIEAYEFGEFHDAERADRSMRLVTQSLREEPHSASEGEGQLRTSIAVIRAFAKNFCNIPPFCSGKRYD